MTNNSKNISVVMPVFNEEQIMENSALKTWETFQSIGLDFEIIIVNDKSTDKSGEIADDLAIRHPNILCVHHQKNLGIGGAFKTGIAHAVKEYVIFVPADNPLEPDDIGAYLPRMGICDIIVGTRIERVGYSPLAKVASFTYNRILVPLLFNIGLSDVNWIQVYRKQLFDDKIIQINHNGIFFLVEILLQAKQNHLIIVEVPAKMKKRIHGKATCFRVSTMIQIFIDMTKYFLKTY